MGLRGVRGVKHNVEQAAIPEYSDGGGGVVTVSHRLHKRQAGG